VEEFFFEKWSTKEFFVDIIVDCNLVNQMNFVEKTLWYKSSKKNPT
jgi:hypothetical protein